MAVPAIIYLTLNAGDGGASRGWAVPTATDIAFALGVLALLGPRVPPALRVLLLTVAVVDDLGAVAIIALAYTADLSPAWSAVALALVAVLALLNRLGVRALPIYAVAAVALWFAVLHAGVHATIAGVVAALAVPSGPPRRGESPLLRIEHALVPWTGFVVVPAFGFANAGVALAEARFGPLALAIALGLFVGKQAGIMGGVWAAQRWLGAKPLPGASWVHLWGMALLCGIGFTMSLFIAALAFPNRPELVEQAKLGILAGSLLSALAGYAVLRLAPAEAGA
jgi:NhaA family Na+:H+ antiporter